MGEYTSFDGKAGSKSIWTPSKKCAMVVFITLALGVYVGVMSLFGWEQHQYSLNPDSQATSVAEHMKNMMADSTTAANAQQLASILREAALDDNVELSLQVKAMHIAKQMKELMADPDFVETAKNLAVEMEAVMTAPIVQEQARHLKEQMMTIVADLESEEQEPHGRRLFSAPPTSQLVRSPLASPMRPLARARDVSAAASADDQKSTVPLLGVAGKLKVASTLSKAGLLTAAEKAGVFSKLEKSGGFSPLKNYCRWLTNSVFCSSCKMRSIQAQELSPRKGRRLLRSDQSMPRSLFKVSCPTLGPTALWYLYRRVSFSLVPPLLASCFSCCLVSSGSCRRRLRSEVKHLHRHQDAIASE